MSVFVVYLFVSEFATTINKMTLLYARFGNPKGFKGYSD